MLGIEARRVGGQIRIILKDEIEAGGHVALFQFAPPEERRAYALHGELVVAQAADHVEVHIGCDLGERHGRFFAKRRRADEADLFAGPQGENDSPAGFLRVVGALLGERRREFHDHGGSGSVVVRARMDLAFLTRAIHRAAGKAVTEMIVVCPDDDVFPVVALGRQAADHVAVGFLEALDADAELDMDPWVERIRLPRGGSPCRARSGGP